jgi:hypothetical protein
VARKARLDDAVAVGESMAAKVLKRRRAAARRRKLALEKSRTIVSRKVIPSGPKALIAKATVTHTSAGVLIAEGDSWFDYPFQDVLSALEDDYGFDVESVAHKGDNVEDMAYSGRAAA